MGTEIVIFTHQAYAEDIAEYTQKIITILFIVLTKAVYRILHDIILGLGDGNLQHTAAGIWKKGKQASGKALLDKAAVQHIVPPSAPKRIHYRQVGFKSEGCMIILVSGIQGNQAGKQCSRLGKNDIYISHQSIASSRFVRPHASDFSMRTFSKIQSLYSHPPKIKTADSAETITTAQRFSCSRLAPM